MDTLRGRIRGCMLVALLVGTAVMAGGCFDLKVKVPDIPDPNVNINAPSDPQAPPPDGRQSRAGGLGAYDTLAYPGQPVQLAAWLIADNASPVGGTVIGFQHDSRLVARGTTDSAGVAGATWTPTAPGIYVIQVRVLDAPASSRARDLAPVKLIVSCMDSRTPLAVVDLDDCIFDSSAKRAWLGSTKANPGSLAALAQIAQRYPVVYSTRKATELSAGTRDWLESKGYPVGPVLLSTALAPTTDARQFKSARPAELMRSFPKVAAAIFEKRAPAEAFLALGARTYLFADVDEKEDDPGDLRDKADEIRRLPQGLNLVMYWHEIQAGVMTGQQFPPAALAATLDTKARRYERRDRND